MKTYTFNCDGTDCKAGRELLAKMVGLWEAEERRIVNATPLSAEQTNELFGFVDAEDAPFSAGFGEVDGYKVTPIGRWICQTAEDGTQFWTVISHPALADVEAHPCAGQPYRMDKPTTDEIRANAAADLGHSNMEAMAYEQIRATCAVADAIDRLTELLQLTVKTFPETPDKVAYGILRVDDGR